MWESHLEEQGSGNPTVQVSASRYCECGHRGRNLRPKKCHRGHRRILDDNTVFGTLDNLFTKTDVSPWEIHVFIVTISIITSVPSIPAQITNRYKQRLHTKSFNQS
ncbi:hypothetical protein V6N13_121867 [Hibiscus sabdariffa]